MPDKLTQIFKTLKKELGKYAPPLTPKADYDSRYDLWSLKDIVIAGRKRREVYFAGLIIQSNYVGFYFMPVYIDREMKKLFGPELRKTLKGKSCFHIKMLDESLLEQIRSALADGFRLYEKREWI